MKALNLFVAVLLFIFVISCNDDDLPANSTSWSLINVTGGIAGVDDTFSRGTIIWTFYDQDGVLEVINDNTVESLIDILETGSYTYSIEDEGTDYHIYIDGMDFGAITKTSQIIIIDQQVNDGFVITFSR